MSIEKLNTYETVGNGLGVTILFSELPEVLESAKRESSLGFPYPEFTEDLEQQIREENSVFLEGDDATFFLSAVHGSNRKEVSSFCEEYR